MIQANGGNDTIDVTEASLTPPFMAVKALITSQVLMEMRPSAVP